MTSTLEELRDDVEEALGPELGSTLSQMYRGMRQRGQAEAAEAGRVLAAAREEDPNMDPNRRKRWSPSQQMPLPRFSTRSTRGGRQGPACKRSERARA